MRIAFFVNSIKGESPNYTTTVLALAALMRGHEICYVTPEDFVLSSDDSLIIRALTPPQGKYKKAATFFKALQTEGETKRFAASEIDILFLRNDPSLDASERPWAAHVGTLFGRLAAARGVLVVNDPDGLAQAQNKLYFQDFPQSVRPETLISKSISEIRDFIDAQKKGVIIKPLQGSGGKNVFKIASPKDANLNQIFEAVSEEGYLIAQRYMPEATAGDIRFFLMNGKPLMHEGKYAAFRRVPADGETRSNVHRGGKVAPVDIDERILAVADAVRPKLLQDGMFLVGLDIVGDKILEINTFTPGGLNNVSELQGVNFCDAVVAALEEKITIRDGYGRQLSNRELAIL